MIEQIDALERSLLEQCTEWRIARAELQKAFAEQDLDMLHGGTGGFKHVPPLERMQQLEDGLRSAKPRTVFLAAELLGIAQVILTAKETDPENELAAGLALEIVRNVIWSLKRSKETTRLGTLDDG